MQDNPSKTVTYRWKGTDRRGTVRTGRTECKPEQLAGMVHRWYRAGWRSAEVLAAHGVAAVIERIDGRRTWWAES